MVIFRSHRIDSFCRWSCSQHREPRRTGVHRESSQVMDEVLDVKYSRCSLGSWVPHLRYLKLKSTLHNSYFLSGALLMLKVKSLFGVADTWLFPWIFHLKVMKVPVFLLFSATLTWYASHFLWWLIVFYWAGLVELNRLHKSEEGVCAFVCVCDFMNYCILKHHCSYYLHSNILTPCVCNGWLLRRKRIRYV